MLLLIVLLLRLRRQPCLHTKGNSWGRPPTFPADLSQQPQHEKRPQLVLARAGIKRRASALHTTAGSI
ncbi:hypothetical protein DIPPA_24529 [Diplonema papillatum]|nr:hypothetical protein DIPPA_24529 [Diplonema papillatum]KAJ9439398.1 hypothetical protein DIPPA_24529 [Diplonema papillatum]